MILELHCLQGTNVGLTLTKYYTKVGKVAPVDSRNKEVNNNR